ncbi:hypothetical protein SNEBB_004357 [Seison nebaliae]|nr:hypothetical protein SNEBB_004357 [Seison nebaliae]
MGKKLSKGNSPLNESEISLLEQATGFSRSAVLNWHREFLNDCPSGQLTKKKFSEVYKQFYPDGNVEHFTEHVFRTFDTDGSNKIDFREFLIAISITFGNDIETKLKWAFKMYDIDSNGRIDKKELGIIIKSIYELMGEKEMNGATKPEVRVEEIFGNMDSTSDGFLSEKEFLDGCTNDAEIRNLLTPSVI